MNTSKKLTAVLLAGGLLSILIITSAPDGLRNILTSRPTVKDDHVIPNLLPTRSPAEELPSPSKRQALRKKLQDAYLARAKPREFIALVPQLLENGLLKDKEVEQIYKSLAYQFNVDDLLELSNVWPDQGNSGGYMGEFMSIAESLRSRDDPAQIIKYLKGLPLTHQTRGDMIYKWAQHMEMFSPDAIATHLAEFAPSDHKSIAGGLLVRVERNNDPKAPDKDRAERIQKYLDVLDQPEIIAPLVARSVSISAPKDPLGTLAWVMKQDPAVVAECDNPIISALMKDHPQEASDYVEKILSGADQTRADRAMIYMVVAYSKKDSVEAWNWVMNLSRQTVPPDEVIATAYRQLLKSNPEKAAEVANSPENPRVKDIIDLFKK